MEGCLFTLSRDSVRCTSLFVAGTAHRCILVVGSQMDAFFATPYAHDLAEGLKDKWAVAQLELGSCRVGFNAPDHESDADDVDAALGALATEGKMTEVVLYGSGTGVQVVLDVLASGSHKGVISRVVLHGGVVAPAESKHFVTGAAEQRVACARTLIDDGRAEDMSAMRSVYDIPITPARLRHSTTLTIQEALWQPALAQSDKACRAALHCIAIPALFLLSTDVAYSGRAEAALPAVHLAALKAIGLSSEDVQVELLPNTIDEHRRVLKGGGQLVVNAVQRFLEHADVRREQRRAVAEAEAVEVARRRRIDQSRAMYA